jgi:hypothetical protein
MKSLGLLVDEAIVHEAGHVVIAKAFGLPVHGVEITLVRNPAGVGVVIERLTTASYKPPDKDIPRLKPDLKDGLTRFIAGGLAGQMFIGWTATGEGANADRKELARYSIEATLEQLAELNVPEIKKRKRSVCRLAFLIRRRYIELMKKNPKPKSYVLLTKQDVDAIPVEKV